MSRIKYSPGVMRFVSASGEITDVAIGPYDLKSATDDFTLATDLHITVSNELIRANVAVGLQYEREFEKLDDPNISGPSEGQYTYGARLVFPEVGATRAAPLLDEWEAEASGVGNGWLGAPLGQDTTSGSQPFVVAEYTIYGSPYNCEGGNIKVSDSSTPRVRTPLTVNQPPAVAPQIPIIIRDLPPVTLAPLGSPVTLSFDVSPCSIQWYEEGVGPIALAQGKTIQLNNMSQADIGRRFYAICTGPSGQAVVTQTTELALGAEGFDPYRDDYVKYQSTYDLWTRTGDFGNQYIPPAEIAPVLATYTTVENYPNSGDSIQDWSTRALQGEKLSRFGPNSLRINGQASFFNDDDGVTTGQNNSVVWFDYMTNYGDVVYTRDVSVFGDPTKHDAPAVGGDFTIELWVKADKRGDPEARSDTSSGDWLLSQEEVVQRRGINALENNAGRGLIFALGNYTTASAEQEVMPLLKQKGYALDAGSRAANWGALWALADGRIGWSSFVDGPKTAPSSIGATASSHYEYKYTIADSDKSNVRDGSWHFVSVTRKSGAIYLHVDGVLAGSGFDSTRYAPRFHENVNGDFTEKNADMVYTVGGLNPFLYRRIHFNRQLRTYNYTDGGQVVFIGSMPWAGNIDSARMTTAIARYDAGDYIPPTTPFEISSTPVTGGEFYVPSPLGAPTLSGQVPEGLYYVWSDVPETALGAPSGVVKAVDNYEAYLDVRSPLGAPTVYGPPEIEVSLEVPPPLFAPAVYGELPDKVLWLMTRSPLGQPQVRAANQYEAKLDVGLLRPSGVVLSGIVSGWLDSPSPLGAPTIRALEGDDVLIDASISARTPLYPTTASGAIPIGVPWGPTLRAVVVDVAWIDIPETALGAPSIVAKDARVDGYLAVPETALGAPTITMGQDFFGVLQVPETALGAPTISGFEVDNYNLYMDVRSPLGPASIYMEQGFGGYLSVPETALGAPTIAAGLDYISALRADTPLGAPSIVAEQGFGGYLSVPETALGAPTIEAFYEFDHEAYLDVAGPLGIPTILAQRVDNYTVYGDVPSPLFAPEILVQYDARFFVDLSIPETALGVPTISGNQGLRADIDIPSTALGVPAVLGTQGFIGELLVPNPLADQAPTIAAFNSFIGRLSAPSPLGAPSIAMAQGFFSALSAPPLPGAPSVEVVQGTGDGYLAVPETALGVPSLWMASVFVIVESRVTVTDHAVIRDYAYYGKVGATTVTDGAVIRDYAYTNNAKRETVLETAVITDRAFERAGALIATDSGVIRAYAYPDSSAKTVIVTETAVIIDHVYTPVTMTVTDSAVITDNATFSKEGRFTVTDTAVITSAVFDRSTSIQPPVQPVGRAIIFSRALTRINAVRVTVHEEAFITDHAYPSGDPDDYVLGAADVWTANTMAWAMSRWATGDITGIAGEFGVANRGLFFESDTEYADMSMETGFINFGSPNLKSVPAMYSYATHPAPMTIQVTADIRGVQQTYTYREMARPAGDHRAVRTLFGKGLKSTYFKVGISSTGYTQIQYTVPVVQDLTRRI